MKVTDIFTLFHKSNPSPPSSLKGDGIKPVAVIDKMSLQPGQLFRGEVLGKDANGHLLLKIGGEIIATRGLVSMTTGQQVWVEVKDVGDSPLFALAKAKGAVHELLKNIMEVRPAVLTQGKGDMAVPPEFQQTQSAELSFVPKLAPLHEGATLPRETTQLFKALLALAKTDVPILAEPKMKQLAPFISADTGRVDVGKVAQVLSQTGKIPPVLGELAPLRPLFVFAGSEKVEATLSPKVDVPVAGNVTAGEVVVKSGGDIVVAKASPPPVPFITGDGQVVAHTTQAVRALVETVPLMANAVPQDVATAEPLSKGFTDLVKSILVENKIPENIRSLAPVKQLIHMSIPTAVKNNVLVQALTSDEFIQGFAETSIEGKTLSPTQHNETVVKLLSGLQGAEPKPDLLRVLKQLVASSSPVSSTADEETAHKEGQAAKLTDAALGVAKVASFFKSQVVVNQEVAQMTQGDCVLVPCFFAGQSGWGEWMWSHESQPEQGESQENLAFFLEMSNLGPVSIQAILGEKSLSGQFQVADEKAYSLISQGLPRLEERLAALGYKSDFSCRQKPVAVMQEIKDTLESRTSDSAPTSLVDIQA